MDPGGLVFGLLDTTPQIGDLAVAAKYRDLTISWLRYSYRDAIIERRTVTSILAEAMDRGYSYCFIQPYGNIIVEHWDPEESSRGDFVSRVRRWITENEFLVAGRIVDGGDAWYGFDGQCVLVNLARYRQLGAPRFERSVDGPLELPKPLATASEDHISALWPSGVRQRIQPGIPGWPLIAACLNGGQSVLGLDTDLLNRMLSLTESGKHDNGTFSHYLGHGIERFRRETSHDALTRDQSGFLNLIASQTANARKGVFLWNIEPYTDVEAPPAEFRQRISSLYSVAAGFKANRILHTHGFDRDTRVVFFDYSPNALAVRKRMVEEWDGNDFPQFVRYLFREFPYPETYYQLWCDLSPGELDGSDLEHTWERELQRWGGAQAFKAHWGAYRELRHLFVDCNILTEPAALLTLIKRESRAVIWWSNAFFTMFSNWYYGLDERRKFYDSWIERLAEINPDILVYGSDHTNASVNCIRAGEYWARYREFGGYELNPCRQHRTEIRM